MAWRKAIDQYDDKPSALDSFGKRRTFTEERAAKVAQAEELKRRRQELAKKGGKR